MIQGRKAVKVFSFFFFFQLQHSATLGPVKPLEIKEQQWKTAECLGPFFFFTFSCHQTLRLSTWESKFQLSHNEVKVTELKATVAAQTKFPDTRVLQNLRYFFFFLKKELH